MTEAIADSAAGPREAWWRRWLMTPVRKQLTQGISVERVSWTISLGFVLGVFPVMGTTTWVCVLAAWLLKLNQGLLHVFKAMVYPLHLVLILVFIRAGQRMWGVPLTSGSVPELLGKFKENPLEFGRDFGWAALQGVSVWLLIAPFAAILLKWMVTPLVRRVADSIRNGKETA